MAGIFPGRKGRRCLSKLASRLFLPALLALQSVGYYFFLPLSMGPHVILQPWLINQGWRIYSELADHHTPLMPVLMAAIQRIIPEELRAAKFILIFVLAVSLILTTLLAKRMGSWRTAQLAALFFFLWSPQFDSGTLRYEAFLTPLYLLAILIYPWGRQTDLLKVFLFGIICGLAFLIKQHALFFWLLMTVWVVITFLHSGQTWKKLARLLTISTAGLIVPFAIFTWIFSASGGEPGTAFFWIFGFNNLELASLLGKWPTGSELQTLVVAFLFVPVFIWQFNLVASSGERITGLKGAILILVAAGILLAVPRFGMEHLQPALPGLAVISALVVEWMVRLAKNQPVPVRILLTTLAAVGMTYAATGFPIQDPSQRQIMEYDPLPVLATRIREATGEQSCPYLLPEDEANANLHYFLGCQPPTRLWLFSAYPWFSRFDLPQQMLDGLKNGQPPWVIYFPRRWDVEKHNPGLINYLNSNYDQAEVFYFLGEETWLMKRAN